MQCLVCGTNWNNKKNFRYICYKKSNTAEKNSKGKGKVHPCTGTEALYMLYDP